MARHFALFLTNSTFPHNFPTVTDNSRPVHTPVNNPPLRSTPLCLGVSGNVPCVENRRWTYGRVTYATLKIQGSCNNLCDTAPDPNEFAARNAANVAWMQDTFAEASKRHSAAIMFISQADPGFDATDATRGPVRDPLTLAETDGLADGFQSFLVALRDQVILFKKPV